MATRRSRGFTLVELLVVISIIGMLAALILPAVNSAIESANRAKCQNNLRELARAVEGYASSHKGKYPPSFGPPRISNTNNAEDTWTWAVYLLNELDEGVRFREIMTDGIASAQHHPVFVCPSDSERDPSIVTPLSYGANMGIQDDALIRVRPGAPARAWDLRANGIFHHRHPRSGDTADRVNVELSHDEVEDGKSNTLLFADNVHAYSWIHAPGMVAQWPPRQTPTVPNPWPWAENEIEKVCGILWNPVDPPQPPSPTGPPYPNDPPTPRFFFNDALDERIVPDLAMEHAIPNSRHPLTWVAAFADGSTRNMSEDMSYRVYCLLMTPRGEEARDETNGPFPYQIQNNISADDLR